MNIRRVLRIAAYLIAGVVVTFGTLWLVLQTPPGHALAAATIEALASSDDASVDIEDLHGWLPGSPRVGKVTVSDKSGPWLVLTDVSLDLRVLPLIWGSTIADEISVRQADWLRQPATSKGSNGSSNALPSIAVGRMQVEVLNVASGVSGKAGRLSFNGQLDLLDPAAKLVVMIELRELGGEGKLTADLRSVPSESVLVANVDCHDRAGGVFASLAGLPADAPLSFTLAGNGPPDNWRATLYAESGKALRASGKAELRRQGSWRQFGFSLDANVGAVGPSSWRSLTEGHTTLALNAWLSDEGAIRIEQLKLTSPALLVSARGSTEGGSQLAEGLATLSVPDGSRLSSLLGESISLRSLAATARISGNWSRPHVVLEATATQLVSQDFRAQAVTLTATADTPASGVFENLKINLSGGGVAAGFLGKLDAGRLTGDIKASVADLAQIGLQGGSFMLGSTVNADRTSNDWSWSGTGQLRDVKSGDSRVDGLLQDPTSLAFNAGGDAAGAVRVTDFKVNGARATLEASGELSDDVLKLNAVMAVPDLSAMGADMSGRADISLAISGPTGALRGSGSLKLADGRLFGLPSKALTVALSEADAKGASRLSLDGDLANRKLAALATVSWANSQIIKVSAAQVSVGSVNLAGDLDVTRGGQATGVIALNATDLQDIAPLIDLDIAGPATGRFRLVATPQQQAIVQLSSPQVRIDTTRHTGLSISGKVLSPFSTMALDLHAQSAASDFDGFDLSRVDATAKGGLQALDIVATGLRDGSSVRAQGRLDVSGRPTRIALNTLTVNRDGQLAKLAAPVTLMVGGGKVDIPAVRLEAGGGRIVVSGVAGRDMKLTLAPDRLPLWVVGLFDAPLPVEALASGKIVMTGRARDRQSQFDLKLVNLSASNAREVARNLTVASSGTTDRNGATFKATLTDPRGTTLRTSGRVPFSGAGTLSIDAQGDADLSLANVYLGATGERARGRLSISARASGTLDSPRVTGTGTIKDGFFRSAQAGLELRNISAQFEGSERRIKLVSLSAKAPNGGRIQGHGDISLDRASGYPVDLFLTAANAQLIAADITTVTTALDLRMTGALMRNPVVRGKVDVGQWDIRIPEKLSRPLTPIAVIHLNAPAGFDAGAEPEGTSADTAFSFGLDVAVAAPRKVFVRGQGIDAEFGGDAKVTGTIDDPFVRGRFDLRRGSISLLNERVSLTRGSVTFAGDVEPLLDISGSITKNSMTAIISAKGKASDPQIVLSSSPIMPQDEILSRLLFAKGTGQLSAFEAAGLAQAIGKMSGLSTGPDILDRLRSMLGIDALSTTTDEEGSTAVTAGSYVGSGVFVGVTKGATNTSGGATVEVDITDNIKARGEAHANGNTRVGVAAEWEY